MWMFTSVRFYTNKNKKKSLLNYKILESSNDSETLQAPTGQSNRAVVVLGEGGRQTFSSVVRRPPYWSSWEHGERRPGLERQCVNVPRDRYVRLQQRGGRGGFTAHPHTTMWPGCWCGCKQAATVGSFGENQQHVESWLNNVFFFLFELDTVVELDFHSEDGKWSLDSLKGICPHMKGITNTFCSK